MAPMHWQGRALDVLFGPGPGGNQSNYLFTFNCFNDE